MSLDRNLSHSFPWKESFSSFGLFPLKVLCCEISLCDDTAPSVFNCSFASGHSHFCKWYPHLTSHLSSKLGVFFYFSFFFCLIHILITIFHELIHCVFCRRPFLSVILDCCQHPARWCGDFPAHIAFNCLMTH